METNVHLLWLSLNHLVTKTSSRASQGPPSHGLNIETKCGTKHWKFKKKEEYQKFYLKPS